MNQPSSAQRRKQLVQTMNDLHVMVRRLDELAQQHADNAEALAGLREAIDVIKRGRAALDKQYHDLVPRSP
jgi:hypothetical protein